jgi:enoyl-[acyl-carrier protein] reductase II
MVLEEGVPVVTTGAGNPSKYMAALQEMGIKVLPIAPSIALAKRLEAAPDKRAAKPVAKAKAPRRPRA